MIKKTKIQQIINCFETGSPEGDYGNVSIFADGKGGARQITYGRSQCTQEGHLPTLLKNYIAANGQYANFLAAKIPLQKNSWQDKDLIKVLEFAGKDPIMVKCQDILFDSAYWNHAEEWVALYGFKENLSHLVIYDSFIHSGGILSFLREKFPESPPSKGGNEKTWVKEYLETRKNWLANHSNKILRNTVYRVNDMLRAIAANDWNLDLPFTANGIRVS